MKKSMLLLAVFALSSAVYAQQGAALSQEQVLEVFSRFNPSVLEKAKQDDTYRAALDNFLASYAAVPGAVTRFDIIAAARNFDDSLRLKQLTDIYQQLWISAKMSGADISTPRQLFLQDVTDVMTRVWAVTVQLRQYQLQLAQERLAHLRQDAASDAPERLARQEQAQQEVASLKSEVKSFKKYAGEHITSAAQDYVFRLENELQAREFSVKRQAARDAQQAARQTTNLQIKSNHKKPVAQ